ncbi:class I SAM-dependent methyltransferase [Hymenobacter sp. RP-2-7]|uniref:Class I SAM-dependent methyltransferase n=1 Tax=Hymenobacter polaris TaxID=2682546 RepID=A0A7Y0AFZ9_9BACT|nr:class I SAM-dependent methyltransferase [Hymenobacter polaris]NML66609.1 class I SAM-dependent methyltransferase [Hymenobacter polaris]
MPTPPAPRHPADYGALARYYDLLAVVAFGGSLRRTQRAALAAGLAELGPAPRVLVLGGGPGWVLRPLWRQCPQAQVLYLEVAAPMLARTAARLRRTPPPPGASIELRLGSERALRPGEQFDALVTFFVLDSFLPETLPAALLRLDAARRPGAPWLVADFWPARGGWRRALLALMYWFFGWAVGLEARRMPPWPAGLAALGLRPTWEQRFFGGAVAAQVWRPA